MDTFIFRPNAGNGLWLGLILPIALILSFIKYTVESSELYHYCFFVSLGIAYTTIIFIINFTKSKSGNVNTRQFIFPAIVVSSTFYIVFNKGKSDILSNVIHYYLNIILGALLCSYSGILSTVGFYKLYLFILKRFPLSFTLGEALFCAQGCTIFLYSTTINLYNAINTPPKTNLQISTLIVQVIIIYLFVYFYKIIYL